MKNRYRRLIRLGLRGKLLLATLTLLLLPFASYFYLVDLETYLKQKQIQVQLESSRLIAGFFNNSKALKNSNRHYNGQSSIYIYPLKNTPIVDGYADDWQRMYIQPQRFFSDPPPSDKGEKFTLLCGIKGNKVYFFLSVNDETTRYKLPIYKNEYDRIKLAFWDSQSSFVHEYWLASEAPGWLKADSHLAMNHFKASEIKGEWQERKKGYQVEFSIPTQLLGRYISVTVYDNGKPISTNKLRLPSQELFNPIVMESEILNQKLIGVKQKLSESQSRLYLINRQAEIVARAGELETGQLLYREPNSFITHFKNLYQFLAGNSIENRRYYAHLSQLTGPEIETALGKRDKGAKSAAAWLRENNSKTLILSTAAPIKNQQGHVIGALVLEKTNADILAMQDQTFEEIILISLILLIGNSGISLLYSGKIVKRTRKLQQAVEQTLTHEDKLNPQFPSSQSRDEIGQLSRSFSTLMKRLNQYTGYLESLAGKLSHELRTPLSVIKSSLENMDFQGVGENNHIFMQRAQDGCDRLSLILTRMGEAGRLEHALQSSEKHLIDMNQFLSGYIDAIRSIHTDVEFALILPQKRYFCLISPELIAQLLDKLTDNAISFHTPQTPIVIRLLRHHQWLQIDIFNQGAWIESENHGSIFDSMVSYRKPPNGSRSNHHSLNLGLGLHVARLISNHHQGRLHFYNRRANEKIFKNNGVSFVLSLEIIRYK